MSTFDFSNELMHYMVCANKSKAYPFAVGLLHPNGEFDIFSFFKDGQNAVRVARALNDLLYQEDSIDD